MESEIYQLSHLLSEQKSLLNSLATTSVIKDSNHLNTDKEETEEKNVKENKQKIDSILEKVEGCKVCKYSGYLFV